MFREDATYDNIKSHKKPGFHSLLRRYIFRKTTAECQTDPLDVLGLILVVFNIRLVLFCHQ